MPISVKRSNFTFAFFKTACYANSVAERNFAASSSYILRHIFRNLSNMYRFEHKNHDILLIFLSQIL